MQQFGAFCVLQWDGIERGGAAVTRLELSSYRRRAVVLL